MENTVSSVTADTIVDHKGTDDDAQGSKDEKSYGEADLLDGGLVVDNVGCLHHDILVRNRECVIYVRHY